MNIILCAGISVRSGTNYIGSIFSEINSVDCLPKNTSKGEFSFFRDNTLQHYLKWIKGFQSSFFAEPNIDDKDFAPYFANAFKKYLEQEYDLKNDLLFVKDPSLYNLERFFDFFPDAKLIILTRSAPDQIASSLKASLLVRKSQSLKKKIKSRIKYHSGYNMYQYSKAYVKHTNQLLKLRKELKDRFLEIKYEDIVESPEKNIKQMLDYANVDYSEEELQNAINAKIVGSSYYGSKKNTQNWGKLNKTKDFKSIGRYESWNFFNRFIFNQIARESNSNVGYEHHL